MLKTGWALGLTAALALSGCGDKDPVSSNSEETEEPSELADGGGNVVDGTNGANGANGIAPGEFHPDAALTFEDWLHTDLAADLNEDGAVDNDDFALFMRKGPDDGVKIPPDPVPDEGIIPELEAPVLFVTGDASEAKQLARWLLDPDLEARLAAIDFESNWLIAALRGRMNTAGFAIAIEQVGYEDEAVQVTVALTDPAPDAMVAQVITYPYDLIVVPVEELTAVDGTMWLMRTTDGRLLARTQFPYDSASSGSNSGSTTPSTGPTTEPMVIDGAPVTDMVIDGTPGVPVTEPVPDVIIDDTPDIPLTDPIPDNDVEPVVHKIDIRGRITSIEIIESERADGNMGIVRVEGALEEDTSVDKAVVTITKDTRIVVRDGSTSRSASFEQLESGQRVEVLFSGPVAESYPVQAVAGEIAILP